MSYNVKIEQYFVWIKHRIEEQYKFNKYQYKFLNNQSTIFKIYTLSCCNNLNSFNSLKVLLVKILCSNAFSIFFIATNLLLSFLSFAATTTPYAPYPTRLNINIII